jgi:hypothetical protein
MEILAISLMVIVVVGFMAVVALPLIAVALYVCRISKKLTDARPRIAIRAAALAMALAPWVYAHGCVPATYVLLWPDEWVYKQSALVSLVVTWLCSIPLVWLLERGASWKSTRHRTA